MEFVGAAELGQLHGRVCQAPLDFHALRGRQSELHSVRMTRAQLDAVVFRGLAVLQDRRQVPILGNIVSDNTDLER